MSSFAVSAELGAGLRQAMDDECPVMAFDDIPTMDLVCRVFEDLLREGCNDMGLPILVHEVSAAARDVLATPGAEVTGDCIPAEVGCEAPEPDAGDGRRQTAGEEQFGVGECEAWCKRRGLVANYARYEFQEPGWTQVEIGVGYHQWCCGGGPSPAKAWREAVASVCEHYGWPLPWEISGADGGRGASTAAP